ncbi:hypothetical protein HanPI659440_Chr09g0322621 [Helianthus annuus]|nr:hypothetical protein HanPI659440_Chr09g0322621 [Helianthus annuus]
MTFATVNMDTTSSGFKLPKDCAICPKLCSPLSMDLWTSLTSAEPRREVEILDYIYPGMTFATVNMDTTSSGFKLPKDCAICPKLCSPLSIGEQGSAFCEDKCWFQWTEADKLGIVGRSHIVSHSLDLA